MSEFMIVYGTRPQFIKVGMLYQAMIRQGIEPVLVHTGQHYDYALSEIFTELVGLPSAKYNLQIGSNPDGQQISSGVNALLDVIDAEHPQQLVVVGDSNSTMIGSLGAMMRNVQLSHIEAGVRSHDYGEPEELNRVFTDRFSSVLLCPTEECVTNLRSERRTEQVYLVGDIRFDAWSTFQPIATSSKLLRAFLGRDKPYCLFTTHRKGVAYQPEILTSIVNMLTSPWPFDIVWPIHPGVFSLLKELKLADVLAKATHLILLPPVSYLDMIQLETHSQVIITDSIGVQLEAYFAHKPAIMLRDRVEFNDLLNNGWSIKVSPFEPDLRNACLDAFEDWEHKGMPVYDDHLFGDGHAAEKIVDFLVRPIDVIEHLGEPRYAKKIPFA